MRRTDCNPSLSVYNDEILYTNGYYPVVICGKTASLITENLARKAGNQAQKAKLFLLLSTIIQIRENEEANVQVLIYNYKYTNFVF